MKSFSVTVLSVLVFASGIASAEQFGDNGTFAIGVDRIFGYVSDTQSYDLTLTIPTGTGTTSTKTTYETNVSNFSFLGRASWTDTFSSRVAQLPRLSFDAFLGPGVSLGGSVMYDHYSISSKNSGVEDPDKPSLGLWLLSPRVGFAYMFTPQVGIWPRAGITYVHASLDSTSTNTTTGAVTNSSSSLSLVYYTMDVNLVVTPVPHVGFTVGPTLDYLLSSSQSSTPPDPSPETNRKEHALGVQAGFLAWF